MSCYDIAGWWYGVVGHLESCDGNETYCRCHNSGKWIWEFFPFLFSFSLKVRLFALPTSKNMKELNGTTRLIKLGDQTIFPFICILQIKWRETFSCFLGDWFEGGEGVVINFKKH